jgi:DNA primase
MRAADILLENGLEVKIVSLPEGHDPDSFVCEHGAEAVNRQLNSAQNVFDHKMKQLAGVKPEARNELVHSILESLAKVKDTIERSLLVTDVAEKLKISERLLWAELETILHRQKRGELKSSRLGAHLNDLGRVSDVSKIQKAITEIIRILLHQWEYAGVVFENVDPKQISELKLFPVLDFLKNQYKGGVAPSEETLLHHFHDVDLSAFIVSAFDEEWKEEKTEQWVHDCIRVIKQDSIQHEIEALREKIRQAQASGQPVRPLLEQCQQLEAEKKALLTAL